MDKAGKYLYCIVQNVKLKQFSDSKLKIRPGEVRAEKEQGGFSVVGIEKKRVYAVSEGELLAIVSDAEIKDYPISRENTLIHQKVIEEVMKEYDVLPVSFGTVAKSEKDLKEKILKPKRKEILSALEKIKGKIELNLKAIWLNLPGIFQEIIKENREIQAVKKEVSQVSGIVRTNSAIELGKMVASALERKKEREAADIMKTLKKIAEDFKENKVQLDQIIFNTAFLVSKEKEKEFDGEVSKLGEKYDGRIKFLYVGPLPPFNFVELEFSLNPVRNF